MQITYDKFNQIYDAYLAAKKAGDALRADRLDAIMDKVNIADRFVNAQGHQGYRRVFPNRGTYIYDVKLCPKEKGWSAFRTDQDSEFFGVWVNQELLRVVTYCEGDETTIQCRDVYALEKELNALREFYWPSVEQERA